MNDMTAVIVPKSDQINADDLIGRTMTIRINEVRISSGQEQPVSIYFDGSDKAFRPCKSMSRVLVAAWGADAKTYVGRSLTLYRDPTVKWGGMEVGGIRISHMTHIDNTMTMALTATKGSRKPYKVQPLKVQDAAPVNDADPAAEWLAGHIARIDAAPDDEVLDAVFKRDGKSLTKLRHERPDLHGQALAAGQRRAAELREGRSDEQHGDQHDGTDLIIDELIAAHEGQPA